MRSIVENLHELSASQAAKLFHLSSEEIQDLHQARQLLSESIDQILARLCSKLSILPGGANLLGSSSRTARTRRGVRRWMGLALRPWNPEVREPGLRHLAIFCAKHGVAASYMAAVFACFTDACMWALNSAEESGRLAPHARAPLAKALRKRLATEELGLLSVYSQCAHKRLERHVSQIEHDLKVRSRRLGSTVSLSRAIADEIDEAQVLRVLAQHVVDTFRPDHVSIHAIEPCDMVETAVTIVDGRQRELPDDAAMRELRKDWRRCRAARTGHVFHVADVREALIKCPHQEWPQDEGSHCCIPLADGTQIFGWMHLRRKQAGGFCQEDIEVLGIYGQIAGSAMRSMRLVKENRYQATTDSLTSMGNRRFFEAMIEKEELLMGRRGGQACLLMLDVDRFKETNDAYGHTVGDRVLKAVADTLKGHVRRSDELARIGGDEFIILLRDCDAAGGVEVAEKILATLADKRVCVHHSEQVNVTVSIGIASRPEHAKTLEEASLLADVALLQAKSLGRNRQAVFTADSGRRSQSASEPTRAAS